VVGWGVPDPVARRIITASLDAVADGRADADRRYPAAPDGMRGAVDAQIARITASPW